MSLLFGTTEPTSIAMVEPSASQWYARRAGVAAVVVGLVVDVLVTGVASVFCPLLLAVLLGAFAGVLSAFAAAVLVRVWPVLRVLWWWSIEITIVVVAAGGWVVLAHLSAWWIASLAAYAVVAGGLACGPVRRFVWAWSWCLVDRHRLRLCFAKLVRSQVRVTGGRPADLPLVLWARPTPAGERAWVWLRPGFSLEAMNDDIGRLMAVACIAKQVRIAGASDRFAAFVRVDIGRRDPLSGRIASPLALLIPSLRRRDADVPVSPAVPPVGLELADIEDLAPEKPRGGRR